jgi:hypothetical protein
LKDAVPHRGKRTVITLGFTPPLFSLEIKSSERFRGEIIARVMGNELGKRWIFDT